MEKKARIRRWRGTRVSKVGREETKKGRQRGERRSLYPSLCVFDGRIFFLRAIFDPRNYFLKSDLFFLGWNYFSNRDLVYLFVFLIEGMFPCEIFDMYNYFLTYLGHGCVLSSSFL